jgi:hypothetical protein
VRPAGLPEPDQVARPSKALMVREAETDPAVKELKELVRSPLAFKEVVPSELVKMSEEAMD